MVFGHRVLDGLALADEVKHHHRVREHRQHRREEAERDVTRDLAAPQSEEGGDDQAEQTEEQRAEQSLSHYQQSMTDRFPADPPSSFVVDARDRAASSVADASARAGCRDGTRTPRAGARPDGVACVRRRRASGRGPHGEGSGGGGRARRSRVVRRPRRSTPLPSAAFELLVVTRYLQRDLFDSIRDAVVPNGVVVYETFTVNQRALGFGPTSAGPPARAGRAARSIRRVRDSVVRGGDRHRGGRAPRGATAGLKRRRPRSLSRE